MVLLLEALVAAGVVFLFYVFMAILTEKVYAACKKAEKEAYLTVNRKNRRIGKQTRPPTDRKKGAQSGFLTF